MSERVLIADDDPDILTVVKINFELEGFEVDTAVDGEDALQKATANPPNAIVLDIMMPRMDGTEVLAELRKARPAQPVIFLTARGEEEDRVRGLRLGADDYVVKPFGIDELIARVEAVLRRSPARPTRRETLSIAGRTVDFDRREAVLPGGARRTLTEREAEVIGYLAANPGRAVSRDELLQRVWGLDPRGTHTRTVDMTIARIRETLDDDPADPKVIQTVRGKGYMLVAETGEHA